MCERCVRCMQRSVVTTLLPFPTFANPETEEVHGDKVWSAFSSGARSVHPSSPANKPPPLPNT